LPTALCLLTVAFLPGRMVGGWVHGQSVRERLQPLAWEGRAGAATDQLAEKYAGVAFPDAGRRELYLGYLSGTKYGPLGKATAPDPRAFRTVSLPVPAPHTVVDMAGGPRRWVSTGPDPYVVFLVHPPEGLPAVRTIRITYRLKSLDGPVARAEVFWIRHDGEAYGYAETGRHWTRTRPGDGAPRAVV